MTAETFAELDGIKWRFIPCYDCRGTGFHHAAVGGEFGGRRECPACRGFGTQRFAENQAPIRQKTGFSWRAIAA